MQNGYESAFNNVVFVPSYVSRDIYTFSNQFEQFIIHYIHKYLIYS